MHHSWAPVFEPLKPTLQEIALLLKGREVLPPPKHILRVFDYSLDSIKVLIIGQDPYPTPGHAVGLSFSVSPETKPFPRGLQNIFREYSSDLGYPTPSTGDLTDWADQGVFLLNRILTVSPHKSGGHVNIGWEEVTEAVVRAVVCRDKPLVSILWGRYAAQLGKDLGLRSVIISAHPSPHSANKGFYGSKPFSRANEMLKEQGADPVNWQLKDSSNTYAVYI